MISPTNTDLSSSPLLLLSEKLHCPSDSPTWVARPELIAHLERGLTHRLTLISAPPGFGKTTLASQWLSQCALPSAWLALDEGDNQLDQFLRYLIAAVRTSVPDACPTTYGLLVTPNRATTDYLIDTFVAELAHLATDLILVLDDYHLIQSSQVHRLLLHLLRYLPPCLHLVILTRTDPPLRLGRMRAEGRITEVRADDLRFTPKETRVFLDQGVSQSIDDDGLQALHTRTEGWVTALHLARLSLESQAASDFLARFGGGDRLVVDYLVEEVMAELPASLREFVLYTAIVDRFCAPLAEALLADSATSDSGQTTLTQLDAQNLFLIRLDDQGIWYRYHDLFRDFLRHQLKLELGADTLTRLHRRASAWFAEAGLLDDALRHALVAGDEGLAAELVTTWLHPVMNLQTPWPILDRWLNLFSESTILNQPGLLVARAYLFGFRQNIVALPPLVDSIEALLRAESALGDESHQAFQADCDFIRGYGLYWQAEAGRAIGLLERAVANLPDSHTFIRAQAVLHLALAYAQTGQRATGLDSLHTALGEATAHRRPTSLILLGTLAGLHLYAADLGETARIAERMMAATDASYAHAWQSIGFVVTWQARADYFLGHVNYERNDLVAAAHHWRRVTTLGYRANPGNYHDSLVGLALIAQAQSAPGDALAHAHAAREFAAEMSSVALLQASDALDVRLALQAGQTDEALRLAQDIDLTVNHGTSLSLDVPPMAYVRALLAKATPTSLTAALNVTTTCLRQAEAGYNTRHVIQIIAHQALVLFALRRSTEAFDALDRALTLSGASGFVRSFLDLGASMADLLREFDTRRGSSRIVKHLLAAFAQEPGLVQRQNLTARYARLHGVTPLTPREVELLTLINHRLSIEEIAGRLIISPNTVKKHANNIYTKLGVRNRREAIAKAQDIGFLTPEASV